MVPLAATMPLVRQSSPATSPEPQAARLRQNASASAEETICFHRIFIILPSFLSLHQVVRAFVAPYENVLVQFKDLV